MIISAHSFDDAAYWYVFAPFRAPTTLSAPPSTKNYLRGTCILDAAERYMAQPFVIELLGRFDR